MRMQFVVVPEWVEAAFKAAGQPLVGLLDPKTLTTTLSKHDVTFYLESQEIIYDLFPGFRHEVKESTPTVSEPEMGLSNVSYWSLLDKQQIDFPFSLGYDLRTQMGGKLEPKHLLGQNNLFTIDDKGEKPNGYKATDWVFDCIILQNNVIAIHPKLADKSKDYNDQLIASYSQLLNIMCQYLPFESVAKTSQFSTYTSLVYYNEYENKRVA